ncbi:MAG: hypothetical protein M3442_14840, partial [Chloroflexota bacterium]|nr:hypothetical protein [Chloroflexota bacterium]
MSDGRVSGVVEDQERPAVPVDPEPVAGTVRVGSESFGTIGGRGAGAQGVPLEDPGHSSTFGVGGRAPGAGSAAGEAHSSAQTLGAEAPRVTPYFSAPAPGSAVEGDGARGVGRRRVFGS